MQRRTVLTLVCTALLLGLSFGVTALTTPAETPIASPTEEAVAAPVVCNCNLTIGACLVPGQTCQACPCLTTSGSQLNGVCK